MLGELGLSQLRSLLAVAEDASGGLGTGTGAGYRHCDRVPVGSLFYRGRQGGCRAPQARWPLQQRALGEAAGGQELL